MLRKQRGKKTKLLSVKKMLKQNVRKTRFLLKMKKTLNVKRTTMQKEKEKKLKPIKTPKQKKTTKKLELLKKLLLKT